MDRPTKNHRYIADIGDAVIDLIPARDGWFITALTETNILGTRTVAMPSEFPERLARFKIELPAGVRWAGGWTGPYDHNPYDDKFFSGHTYLVQGKLTRLIKIGASIALGSRFAALQGGSPDELAIIKALPGGFRTEAILHKRFAADRHHGEWFVASPDLSSFIDGLCPALLYPLIAPAWRNGAHQTIEPPPFRSADA